MYYILLHISVQNNLSGKLREDILEIKCDIRVIELQLTKICISKRNNCVNTK